jgi:hypothetical protein
MPTSKDLKDLDSQLKKTVISAESFKRGSSFDLSKNFSSIHKNIGSLAGHTRKLVIRVSEIEKKVNNNSKKITSLKNISKTQSGRISGTNIGAKLPGGTTSNVEENISAIAKSVNSIAEIFAGRKKLADDTAAYEKRKAEQEKRGLAESKLEKVFQGIAKTAEKIIAPVKSLLDRILDFIGTVILGRIVFKIIEWMGDPKNASKVKSIIRFVKDWWPALIGSYILFGTTFGRFVRGMTGMLGRFIFQVGKVAIPQLLRFIRTPFGKAALLFTAGATIPAMFPGTVNEQERKTKAQPGSTEEKIRALEQQKANLNLFQKMQGVGSEIDEQIYSLKTGKTKAYAGGGFVNGFSGGAFTGMVTGPGGPKGDKIPAMLSDGEFIVSAGAVDTWGLDTFEAMNAAGGGTNRPRIVRGTTFAAGGGPIGKTGDYRANGKDPVEGILNWFSSQGIDPGNPNTWGGKGGGFKMPGMPSGGGFKMPNIGGIKIPSQFGGGTIGDLGKQASKIGESASGIQKYIQDTINKVKSDPRVQNVSKAVGEIQKKLIKNGYLNEDGKLSGAAKNQATNFLSDLLPNLPFVNAMNKMKTESYLKSIGISKENAKYGDLAAQAMITGKSGIESAYNIGQMQLNKMSKESKKIYLDTLKERMASGTLKSGDVINPYGKVDKSDPRYREQGSVRFYVDPKTGKGYLLDTYGFDPGKVDLGGPGSAAQKQYEKQVKSFQDPNKKIKLGPLDIPIGRIAKQLDLKPMQDATEGGGLPQYILALRNKMFGYDAQKEGAKLDPKRFKSKAQIDELKELGNLKKFAAQLSPQQKKLVDDKLRKEKSEQEKKKQAEIKNQKALEAKRPWWDKLGLFGGASAQMSKKQFYGPGGDPSGSGKGQAQIAKTKPKASNIAQSTKPKPKVTVVSAPKSKNKRGGGKTKTSTPNFGATCPKNGNQKKKILGIF